MPTLIFCHSHTETRWNIEGTVKNVAMWKESEFSVVIQSLLPAWAPVCMEQVGCLISAMQLILGQDEKRCNCHICIHLDVASLIHVLIFATAFESIFWGLFVVDFFFFNLLSDENGQKQNSAKCKWIKQMGCKNILYRSGMEIEIFVLPSFEQNHKTFHGASVVLFYSHCCQTFKRW